jgi:methionyl-tRNA formyltransferase
MAVLKSTDLVLLFAFGQIIPKDLLNAPKLGFWNIHPSLLPKYRGPSPIAYPLILGEKETGVTIIKMDEKIDHGPIIAQEKLKIEDTDRRPDLEKKLTDLGFVMFKKLIINTRPPMNRFIEQQHTKATYTRLLRKDDGFIPLTTLKKALSGQPLTKKDLPTIIKSYYQKNNLAIKQFGNLAIYNLFRGLYPWPGIWTILPNGKRLKIIDMKFETPSSKIQLTKVQLEGKREVDFETFNQAYQVF